MDITEKIILDDSQFSSVAKKTIETLEKMKDANNAVADSAAKASEAQKKAAQQTSEDSKKLSESMSKSLADTVKSRNEIDIWNKGWKEKLRLVVDWEKQMKKAHEEELKALKAANASAQDLEKVMKRQQQEVDEWAKAFSEATKNAGDSIKQNIKDKLSAVGGIFAPIIEKFKEIEIGGVTVGDAIEKIGGAFTYLGNSVKTFLPAQTKQTAATTAQTAATTGQAAATATATAATATNTVATNTSTAATTANNLATRALAAGKLLLSGAVGLVTTSFRAAIVTAKLLAVTLAATGIGALVIALAGLYKYLTDSQEGMDKLRMAGAYLRGVFEVLGNAVKNIGKVIVKAFEDPQQAVSDLYEAIKTNLINRLKAVPQFFVALGTLIKDALSFDFGVNYFDDIKKGLENVTTAAVQFGTGLDEMQQQKAGEYLQGLAKDAKDTANAFVELEKQKIAVEEATTKLMVKEAMMKVTLEQAKKDSDDITLSYTKRIAAAKTAVGIEQEILEGRISITKQNLAIAEKEAKLTEETRDTAREIGGIRAELAQLTAESLRKQAELQEKLNSLLKQAETQYKSIRTGIVSELKELGILSGQLEFDLVKEDKLEKLTEYGKKLNDILDLNKMLLSQAKTDTEKQVLEAKIVQMNEYIDRNNELIKIWEAKKWQQAVDELQKLPDALTKTFTNSLIRVNKEIDALKLKEIKYGISLEFQIATLEKEKAKIERALKDTPIARALIAMEFEIDKRQKTKLNELLFPSDEEIKKATDGIQKITNNRLQNIDDELNDEETKFRRIQELERLRLETVLESLMMQRAAYKLVRNEETLDLDRQIAQVREQLQKLTTDLPFDNFQELWEFTLKEMFGPENARIIGEFVDGASIAFNQFNNLLQESQQLQIEAIDKQLEKLSEKREELETALDYELELREQGLANNVGDKQREVDAILAEEARLEQQKEAIKVAAQKRQFQLDTLSQTQDLITSAIGIYKGFKDIPFGLGIPLAVATIAGMFAYFAKVKIEAAKATKLSTGADRISDHFGYGARYGETDLEGRGRGYRLVNEATGAPTNVIISGREMLLPEKYSLEHELFFQKMKTGAYNGMDLNAAMGFYLNFKDRNSGGGGSLTVQQKITPQKPNRQWIPFVTKDGKSGAVLKTITEKELDGSIIHFDL